MGEEWTDGELALQAAASQLFGEIANVSQEGGRVQEALLAILPEEIREQAGMALAMAGVLTGGAIR